MARYIDASKLIQSIIKERDKIPLTLPCAYYELCDVKPNRDGQSQRAGMRKALRCIEETPTADVVEVKHGEWIEDGYAEKPCVCSYCGEEAQYISRFEETFDYDWEENLQSTGYEEIREYIRTPYCPNCGAKIDERRETNAE